MNLWRALWRSALVPAVFLIAYLGSNAVATHFKVRHWLKHPAAPGRLVDIGNGVRLYAVEQGAGPETVVIAGALGSSTAEWAAVQAQLAPARVIAYERAGIGWSDAADAPRTPAQAARELNTLLDALDVRAPVILVGHSLGGLYAQTFARLYPARVAGVVFVDPMVDLQAWQGQLDARLIARYVDKRRMLRAMNWTAPLGLQRLMPLPYPVAAALKEHMRVNWSSHKTVQTMQAEYQIAAALDFARLADAGAFPAVPVKVLYHDPDDQVARMQRDHATLAQAEQIERVWQELTKTYLALSPIHEWIVSSGGAHLLHLEAPGMVVGAVKKLLAEERLKRARVFPDSPNTLTKSFSTVSGAATAKGN